MPVTAKKRDTSQKRQTIVDAALEVFAKEGFELASMDQIALAANASKRTVYNHFPSKDELFYAVIARLLTEQQTRKQIVYNSTQSLEQQLEEFADAHAFIIDDPSRLAIARVLNSMIVRQPQKVMEIQASIGTFADGLERWLRAATEDKRLEVKDPVLAAKVFYAMIEGAFNYPALSGCLDVAGIVPMKHELIQTFLSRHRI